MVSKYFGPSLTIRILHRSVINEENKPDMYPRYSIDIRYYDEELMLDYNTSLIFKIKKLFS